MPFCFVRSVSASPTDFYGSIRNARTILGLTFPCPSTVITATGTRRSTAWPRSHRSTQAYPTPVKPSAFRVYECPQMLLARSEEHTSELQSLRHLVCRLLLEK